MTDVVERARAALEGVTEGPWEFTDGVVWCVDVIAVTDPSDPTGQTPMPQQVQEKVCDTSPDDAAFIAAARTLVPELVAEVERLHSWDGLMSLVDEHYPEDIFPTEEDRDTRDPGPRIISLLRTVDGLRSTLFLIREARIDYDAALRNREHGGVAAQRFVDAVESALDGGDQ